MPLNLKLIGQAQAGQIYLDGRDIITVHTDALMIRRQFKTAKLVERLKLFQFQPKKFKPPVLVRGLIYWGYFQNEMRLMVVYLTRRCYDNFWQISFYEMPNLR